MQVFLFAADALIVFQTCTSAGFVEVAAATGGDKREVCFFAAAMQAECLQAAGAGGGFLRFFGG